MKTARTLVALVVAAFAACAFAAEAPVREPAKVIFDTDMLTDYDDIGAIAILHALADAGECEILATMSSTRGNSSVAVCEVVNAWYGRPDIPVGCVRGIGIGGRPTTGDGNGHGKFREIAAKYARFVKHPDSSQAPDALEVYRQVLSAQPDGSVTVCTVGFTSNLRRLVEAYPELVAKKVKLWVAMACRYPDGEEYNSSMDAESSRIAFEKWPTPIVFSDFDYGRWIFTGRRIAEDADASGPVKDLFAACLPARSECSETTYDRREGHPSWDETAVLYAVRGAGDVFGLERGTYRMAPAGGRNVWKADPSARDARIVEKLPKAEVGRIIDELMCRRPRRAEWARREAVDMGRVAPANPCVEIVADRADCSYLCGEKAVFEVLVKDKSGASLTSGVVQVRLDNFGGKVVASNAVDLAKGNPFRVEGTLWEPGFLRVLVDGANASSVGFEPERIVKGSAMPEDFDAFWRDARAKLAREVPLDPQVEIVPERCTKDFDFFRISFATFGRRVYGLMAVPTGAKQGRRYPLVFQVAAAGLGDWSQNLHPGNDEVKVFMTVYDWPPLWGARLNEAKAKYDRMNEELRAEWKLSESGRYCTAGLAGGRETYWFYPVILGIDRVVDWAAERAEVDQSKGVVYEGTSQGGMFGLMLTGLNKRITRTVLFVPAGCDTLGYLQGDRQSGWPYPIESQSEADKAAALANAPYFDGANFAARIECPVRFVVGYSDVTCQPAAVWAGYNACPAKDKAIAARVNMTHGVDGASYAKYGRWVRGR